MKLTVLLICLAFVPLAISAQPNDLSGKVSFLSLTTTQEKEPGAPEVFASNVLLLFERQDGSSRFLAMTDREGTAVIPIEAGTYCASAYGVNGRMARLSTYSSQKLHRCFTVTPGNIIEFSLTLAADAKWEGTIPSLGVN